MNDSWIWLKDGISTENERGCFVETIHVDSKDESIILKISADTRYAAYVNGREIGRGPIRSTVDNWYYDEYDITPCLQYGGNHLAIRVWNYGWSTYQSLASEGGLCFWVQQGDGILARSGENTRSSRDLGHKYNTVKRNVNLGFTDYYDARKFNADWIRDPGISKDWGSSKRIGNRWGSMKKRPIKPFNQEFKLPQRVVEFGEVKKGCRQLSLNTRKAFFGDRRDADETIFAGFIGFVLEAPEEMEGVIAFPNRTWNGIIGDFKLDGTCYRVENARREIGVALKKGRQLFLLQVSGKFDDLYCHVEFKFPGKIEFGSVDGKPENRFFVIGPTDRIVSPLDGRSRVYGGLEEFDRMEGHTALHEKIFSCSSLEELLNFRQHMEYIDGDYVFFDQYIYSLVRNDICVKNYPVTDQVSGLLWDNQIATLLPAPVEGDSTRIIVDFGDLMAGSLEFALRAEEGTVLDIYCFENMFEGKIDYTVGLNNSVRYICRQGYQSYRCMARMGLRYAVITVRNQNAAVELWSFGIRHSTYAVGNMGSFRSGDHLLNKLWDMSRQTHLLCLEDTFTDCPTYEQAFWIGDAQISAYVNGYLFGEYELIRHNLRMAVSGLKNTPLMNALAPTDWNTSIPMWMMNWVLSLEFYAKVTGDREMIKELYPHVRDTLTYYSDFIDEKGAFLINAWNMLDWAGMDIHNYGVVTGQQAILAYCYRITAEFARELGYGEDSERFAGLDRRLLGYIDACLWDDGRKMFTDGWTPELGYSRTVGIQTHALLVLFGAIVDGEKLAVARKYLEEPPESFLDVGSPFILFHLYEVWANSGRTDHMLKDMRKRWEEMLRYDSTTCWEVFPGFYEVSRTRSYCHSWSSFPAYFLNKYILGVSMKEDGFRRIELHVPETDIQWCEGAIPTPCGRIQIRWSVEKGEKNYFIAVPNEITVEKGGDFEWNLTIERYAALE